MLAPILITSGILGGLILTSPSVRSYFAPKPTPGKFSKQALSSVADEDRELGPRVDRFEAARVAGAPRYWR